MQFDINAMLDIYLAKRIPLGISSTKTYVLISSFPKVVDLV